MKPVIADWLIQPGGIVERLVALRIGAELRAKDLAERLSWQQSKVSKLENGKQLPSADDLRQWAEACDVPDEADGLVDLLSEVQSVTLSWKRRVARGDAAAQATHVELVEQSKVVRSFETVFVPGLLQVPDYARALLVAAYDLHDIETRDIDEAVALRLQSQQALYNSERRFQFLLAEPALRWLVAPPDVMHTQLDRLLMAVGMPHVELGILPIGVPLDTAPQHAFVLYDDVAVIETFTGETTHREDDSALYVRVMDRLWERAVTGAEARRLIVLAAQSLGSGTATTTEQ
ncbi:MAG: helix-turn-helix domain-containing protein [Acidimicrobiales bacterium]